MAFPDIVDMLVDYLTPIVAPTLVASRVPDPVPDELVRVRRVGGNADPPVRDRARVDFQCWAPTEPEAMQLANTVRSSVWALTGTTTVGVEVYAINEFLGPRMDDDELTGTPRAWFTEELMIRADDVIHYH